MNLPDPPCELDPVALDKWNDLVALVWDYAWNPATGDALANYCVNWSRWQQAEGEIAKTGAVVKSPSGYPIQNPYLSISNRAQAELRKWGRICGITGPRRQIEISED